MIYLGSGTSKMEVIIIITVNQYKNLRNFKFKKLTLIIIEIKLG